MMMSADESDGVARRSAGDPLSFAAMHTGQWQDLDRAHYLHPFTDHAGLRSTPARVVTRAEGVYVWDTDGERILDGLSGLGCVNIGYGRRELVEAAAAQMQELSFCQSFFKTTHRAAITLARELTEVAPGRLDHVFFQTSGSEANETAVRLVRRYWDITAAPRWRRACPVSRRCTSPAGISRCRTSSTSMRPIITCTARTCRRKTSA
jgi:putrescine aminotransferase